MIFDKIKLLIEKFKDLDGDRIYGIFVFGGSILAALGGLGGLLSIFTDVDAFALLGLPFAVIFQFLMIGLWALIIFYLFIYVITTFNDLSEGNHDGGEIIWLLIKLIVSFFLCAGLAWYFFEFVADVFPVFIKGMMDISNFF